MLETVTFILAMVLLVTTIHGALVTSPDKHRKWFVGYFVLGVILIFSQAYLSHIDAKSREKAETGLRDQVTLLVNSARTQASTEDIKAIGAAVTSGFSDLQKLLADYFKGKPGSQTLPPRIPAPEGIGSQTPPPIEHIQFSARRTTSDIQGVPWGWQVIMQTNVSIEPVAFQIDCDQPIDTARVFIAGSTAYMQRADAYSTDRKSYSFSWHYPSFTPMAPLVVTVFSKENIHITKISKIQPLF